MPTYTFRCEACGLETDVMQVPVDKRDDPSYRPMCPEHGAMPRKTVTTTNFALKGRGWFKDGYHQ
jgi:putative FmdB family regulatory protein